MFNWLQLKCNFNNFVSYIIVLIVHNDHANSKGNYLIWSVIYIYGDTCWFSSGCSCNVVFESIVYILYFKVLSFLSMICFYQNYINNLDGGLYNRLTGLRHTCQLR